MISKQEKVDEAFDDMVHPLCVLGVHGNEAEKQLAERIAGLIVAHNRGEAPPAAAPVAAGEPVAWMYDTPNNGRQYSDKRLDHYWWDAFKDSYVKGVPLYAAPPAAAHGALPSLAGICRVDDHPHGVLLILRSSPTEDDLRAIQQALRGDTAAHGDEAVMWVECGERMPESGQHVLAFYTNRSGRGRRIRANYVAPKTHEVDFADPDTQCVEYDEEADCFYLQAGWYELIDNWEEYSSIAVIEGEISHWMQLPAQPAMRAQAGEGGEV